MAFDKRFESTYLSLSLSELIEIGTFLSIEIISSIDFIFAKILNKSIISFRS